MGIPSVARIAERLFDDKTEFFPGEGSPAVVRQAMQWAETEEVGEALQLFAWAHPELNWKSRVREYGRRVDLALRVIDLSLGTFGVEYVANADTAHGDEGLSYANAGDPYWETILYDHRTGRWLLDGLGEHVERNEARFISEADLKIKREERQEMLADLREARAQG